MIVIKIELHSARTGKVSELGKLEICNDGTSVNPQIGHYTGRVLRKPDFKTITRRGKVSNHFRNKLTVWHLLGKMLKDMGYTN